MKISECPAPNYSTCVEGLCIRRKIHWWPYAHEVLRSKNVPENRDCPTFLVGDFCIKFKLKFIKFVKYMEKVHLWSKEN